MRSARIVYVLVAFTVILQSCTDSIAGDAILKEKTRIESNDHKVDAVLVETDGGATTSDGVNVFIVEHGKKLTSQDTKYSVFNCDHYSSVQLSWTANKELSIAYNRARIFNYTNFWEDSDVDDFKYIVEIKLNCTSDDHHQLDESER